MIAINELNPSYMTEMEANEVDSIFGGVIDELVGVGVPDPSRSIVFTPIGGTAGNLAETLGLAIDFAGLNGFVSEVLHGGSFSFLATPPIFIPVSQLP